MKAETEALAECAAEQAADYTCPAELPLIGRPIPLDAFSHGHKLAGWELVAATDGAITMLEEAQPSGLKLGLLIGIFLAVREGG